MSYRSVITRHTLRWAVIATGTRLPIAMAPLAMIFLLPRRGGYATGSVLAACFILGEVVGAGALGAVLDRRRLRRQMLMGLAIGLAGFAVLALTRDVSPVLLGAAAFVAGAGPAVAPGILRTALTNLVGEAEVARAFSADSVLTELVWLAAPAIVVSLALGVAPQAPLAVCVVAGLVALVGTALTSEGFTSAGDGESGGRPPLRVIMTGLPIYLTSAATMALSAAAELTLPALLRYRGLPVGWAGPLLTGLAAFSALGAFLYGLRRAWPGTAARQSLVLLLGTTASITIAATVGYLAGIIAGYLAAGLFQSVVLITRSLSLRERLPASAHPAGYSVMYAVQGIGYSLVAVIIAATLSHGDPVVAILTGVAVTVLLTIASAFTEWRGEVRSPIGGAAESRS